MKIIHSSLLVYLEEDSLFFYSSAPSHKISLPIILRSLYECPVVVLTGNYKLGGLKQQEIFSQNIVGHKSQNSVTGPKSRLWQSCLPSRGSTYKSIPCLSQLLVASPSWLVLSSLRSSRLASLNLSVLSSHCLPSLCFSNLLFIPLAIPKIVFRVNLGNPCSSLLFKILNLITSANTIFPKKITFINSEDYSLISSGAII